MRAYNDIISSNHNQIVKTTIEIRDNPQGKLFLEGAKLIVEAIKSGHKIEYSLIQKDYEEELLSAYPEIAHYDYYLVTRQVLEKVSSTISPQGIVSIVEYNKINNAIDGRFIVLDNIQDPGNLGSIIRSASGTKFKDICLINGANPFSQKVIRSTMGRIFDVNIHRFSSSDDFISFARENNLSYYSCSMSGDNLYSMDIFPQSAGVVVGNEGQGISREIINNSCGVLSIPMRNDLESLNASVSLGIVIYYLDNIK